ncbi:hypothetical protein [Gluconobacter japonicus]|uniref:hypothetical protein n=1 Tax=Gluconobacter japonicus TaxID=376620 RepID=UPI0039EBCA4D
MTGSEAEHLRRLIEAAGWTRVIASDEGGEIPRDMLAGSGKGVRLTATRPTLPDGIEAVLTRAGLAALLERGPVSSVVWVEGLDSVIDTVTVRYAPWGTTDLFTPGPDLPNPVRTVRVLGADGPGTYLGRWLLRSLETDVTSPAFKPWRSRAASRLLSALAQEIEPDGRLLVRGPPPTRFSLGDDEDISADSFAATQAAVSWVYENDRELENKHGLLAAEIARTSLCDGGLAALAATLRLALEGARIAYNFGVTQQSKDTLKALSDLRKAVTDDAAKLSETTRSLATAIVGAVFGNIGLIVARLTLPTNGVFVGPAAMLLGIVLAIYVGSIICSGGLYISIQRDLRRDWRWRLYRFLGDDEYQRMVEHPATRGERLFCVTALTGILMTILLLVAVYFIALREPFPKTITNLSGNVTLETSGTHDDRQSTLLHPSGAPLVKNSSKAAQKIP